jgi:hypothetical protein
MAYYKLLIHAWFDWDPTDSDLEEIGRPLDFAKKAERYPANDSRLQTLWQLLGFNRAIIRTHAGPYGCHVRAMLERTLHRHVARN